MVASDSTNLQTVRIVLTGAPASAKTEFFEQLKTVPEFEDFVFLDELARRLLESNPAYFQNLRRFHLDWYRQQVTRENEVAGQSFISDRGTVDSLAHPALASEVGTTLETEYDRYTAVIHLGSAANLGKGYYISDSIRPQSINFVLNVERVLKGVWQNHPEYYFVPAEKQLDVKYRRFLSLIKGLAGRD